MVAVPLVLAACIGVVFSMSQPQNFMESAGGFFAVAAVAVAAVWYVACRALAWIVNGFREQA